LKACRDCQQLLLLSAAAGEVVSFLDGYDSKGNSRLSGLLSACVQQPSHDLLAEPGTNQLSKWLRISRQCGLDEHVALCMSTISSSSSSVRFSYDELASLSKPGAEWYLALKDTKLSALMSSYLSLEEGATTVGRYLNELVCLDCDFVCYFGSCEGSPLRYCMSPEIAPRCPQCHQERGVRRCMVLDKCPDNPLTAFAHVVSYLRG
jgi:hypothetical protein